MTLPLRLLVAYDGTKFSGYQVQPAERTVQGTLEDALGRLAQRPVKIRGAGRTDAGVHALGQVVSIDDAGALEPDMVIRAMPSLLASDLAVVDAQFGPIGFDARRSALSRSYVYLLWCSEAPNPLYDRFAPWMPNRIDQCLLAEAMRVVVGTHDFSSFGRVRPEQSPVRRIVDATAVMDGPFLRISVTGESFLHNMVRSIVGSALEVGMGRRPVSWMHEALEAKDRSAAGPVALACGLALTEVGYKDVDWPRRQPNPWPWSDQVIPQIERGVA